MTEQLTDLIQRNDLKELFLIQEMTIFDRNDKKDYLKGLFKTL